MIDLYDGTLGLKHNKNDIVKHIVEYMIRTDEDLSYGIREDNTQVILITGKNDLEHKIPTFYHPVIFEYKNTQYVSMDMRLFVSKPKEDGIPITKLIKDTNNGNIALYRTILTKMFLDNDLRFLLAVNKSVLDMFTAIITTVYRNTTMDSQLTNYVSLGCNYHYITFENDNPIQCDQILRSISDSVRNVIQSVNPDILTRLTTGCTTKNIPNPSKLLGDLVDTITYLGEDTRASKVTSDVLLTALSRMFFALNTAELSIAMIESKANMIAILYGILSNTLQKKSIIYRTIDFGKRYNHLNDFLSVMERTIKEQIVL